MYSTSFPQAHVIGSSSVQQKLENQNSTTSMPKKLDVHFHRKMTSLPIDQLEWRQRSRCLEGCSVRL